MASPLTRSLLKRILLLTSLSPATSSSSSSFAAASALGSLSSISHNLSTSTETRSQKLDRIADELISLNKLERYDYSILFRRKLGLSGSAPSLAGLDPSGAAAAGAGSAAGADAKAAEKTVFDVKLDKFDAAAKIKVIKEVRAFTELGLKEAKDLVEKAPIVVKKGVSKEEGESIIEKLKALGATVVLE